MVQLQGTHTCCDPPRGGNAGVPVNIKARKTVDYEELKNLPSINGETLVGDKSFAQLGIDSDKTFVYTQATAAQEWTVVHNLQKYPAVTVVDSAGSVVVGDIDYITENEVKITFMFPFSGKVYCN
jgi:hypothetical protein